MAVIHTCWCFSRLLYLFRYGTTVPVDEVQDKTQEECQFLIGAVQRDMTITKKEELKNLMECQFLIGTVQHLFWNGGVADILFQTEESCQFLIGTVQLRCSY